MGIKYTYDGVEHSVEGNSTTLTTKNKLCKTDIEIEYDGIVPSGTININTNGNHNVANYETANVNVPNGTETKNITQNGTYTPTSPNIGFSQVVVNVPEQKPEQTKTLTLGASQPQTVNPDSGKVLSQVPVVIDNTVIKAENIKKDVVMLGITGTHEGGSATKWGATLDDMFNGSVPAIPTLHDVVIPSNTLTPLQRVFRYSTIKSFTITSPFCSNSQYDYVYAVANTPYLETINIQRGVSWSNSSTNWQQFAYQSTGLKHLSVDGLVGSANNSFTQMFCYCTNLEDVVWYFNPNTPYFQYTYQFNNTFRYCHKLTKITFSGLVRCIGNATNVFNYCFGECYASFDEDINHFRFPNLEYIGITTGTANHSNFKYAFTSSDSSYYGKCSLIFPEMYAIYNRNTTATNGHFASCNALGKIYLPKFTNDGTTGQNIFYNCPYLTEMHFGIENQATVQALNGYASKFGATNATLYFDLVNHITVNGVVYDRSGAEYDYDTSHYSWKNGNDIYYTTNALTPAVGDTVYTKSGDTYTSAGTITAIA